METFCLESLILQNDFEAFFIPDFWKAKPRRAPKRYTFISFLNVPSEADEELLTEFLEQFADVEGPPRYPTEKSEENSDIKYKTGTPVYRVSNIVTHIPHYNRLFGRTVKCIYTGQPLDDDEQTIPQDENEQQPEINNNTSTDTESKTDERESNQGNNRTEITNNKNQNKEKPQTNHEQQQNQKKSTNNTNSTQNINNQQPTNINKNDQNINTNKAQPNITINKNEEETTQTTSNITICKKMNNKPQNIKTNQQYEMVKEPPTITDKEYPKLTENNNTKQHENTKNNDIEKNPTSTSQIQIIPETQLEQN